MFVKDEAKVASRVNGVKCGAVYLCIAAFTLERYARQRTAPCGTVLWNTCCKVPSCTALYHVQLTSKALRYDTY